MAQEGKKNLKEIFDFVIPWLALKNNSNISTQIEMGIPHLQPPKKCSRFLEPGTIQPYRLDAVLQLLKGTNMATLFIFIVLALGTIPSYKNIMQYKSQGLQNFCRTRIRMLEK